MPDNPDDLKPLCALCGEELLPEDDTVLDVNGLPYHQGCWDEDHKEER